MSHTSLIYPGALIIDDDVPEDRHIVEGFGTGLDYANATAAGYEGAAEAFPSEWLIPESEWEARIKEKEQRKTRLSDRIKLAGLPCKNQEQTPLCWANATLHTLEIERVKMNEPMVILSPASLAGPITGFRYRGGWGREAIEALTERGADPVTIWPANQIDRRYHTEAAVKEALKYRLDRWVYTDNSWAALMSCLLRDIPLSAGLTWWGHQVCYVDALWLDGAPAIGARNSWGNIPDKYPDGWFVLRGRKAIPSDTVGPIRALAA